jgi:hypothetical protein
MLLYAILVVYVLLGVRAFVSWVRYCRQDPDFSLVPLVLVGCWMDWAFERYEFDYDEADFPEFEGWITVIPFFVPFHEAVHVGIEIADYRDSRKRHPVVSSDDTNWSRIEEDDVR